MSPTKFGYVKNIFFPVNTRLFYRAIFDFILETKFHAIVIEISAEIKICFNRKTNSKLLKSRVSKKKVFVKEDILMKYSF